MRFDWLCNAGLGIRGNKGIVLFLSQSDLNSLFVQGLVCMQFEKKNNQSSDCQLSYDSSPSGPNDLAASLDLGGRMGIFAAVLRGELTCPGLSGVILTVLPRRLKMSQAHARSVRKTAQRKKNGHDFICLGGTAEGEERSWDDALYFFHPIVQRCSWRLECLKLC